MTRFNQLFESKMADALQGISDDLFAAKNDNEIKKLLKKHKGLLGDMDTDKIVTSIQNAKDSDEVMDAIMAQY